MALLDKWNGLLNALSLSVNSVSGGSQRITLSGGLGQGVSQACRFCRIQAYSTNKSPVRVRIGSAVEDATKGVEIPGNPILTPYTISNLNQLYFYSTQATAVVDIEWFS